jgi:hypothetical protein
MLPYINDKIVIIEVINLHLFNQEQLYFINLVRINLQMIFLLELVEQNSNRIKSCYLVVIRDKNSQSLYKWPKIIPPIKAKKIWKQFLIAITTNDKVLVKIIQKRDQLYHRVSNSLSSEFWPRERSEINSNWYDRVRIKEDESLIDILLISKVTFVVDRLFFLEQSHLISSA